MGQKVFSTSCLKGGRRVEGIFPGKEHAESARERSAERSIVDYGPFLVVEKEYD